MRYAVFSDVHANLEAFEAVLGALKTLAIDKYLFVGDIVGYGADPRECVALLKQIGALSVAGNHDWAAARLLEPDDFTENAQEAVLWTWEHITDAEKTFLSGLPLVGEQGDICCVHGTLFHPEEFDYMTDGYKAMGTFDRLKQKICFVGHLHRPGIFVETEERVVFKPAQDLALQAGKRYIINVGSVGQPRDADQRACLCVYDDAASTVEFRRVAYDVASAQKKILAAGLPAYLAERLILGE